MQTTPVRVDQWRYGAATVKPTVIRAMNSTVGRYELHRHYVQGLVKPTAKLGGRDQEGQWKTAAAKEYPAAMRRALAFSVIKDLAVKYKSGHRCTDCSELGVLYDWLC